MGTRSVAKHDVNFLIPCTQLRSDERRVSRSELPRHYDCCARELKESRRRLQDLVRVTSMLELERLEVHLELSGLDPVCARSSCEVTSAESSSSARLRILFCFVVLQDSGVVAHVAGTTTLPVLDYLYSGRNICRAEAWGECLLLS